MFCGLDLGSRSVKMALFEGDQPFSCSALQFRLYDTIDFYRRFARGEEGRIFLDLPALGLDEPESLCACGYGRQAAALSFGLPISEIQAHAYGAMVQTGSKDFLLIDLGGQDSKVIRVKEGRVVDFSANDKCAAGSGRYLENMAAILGLSPEELGSYGEEPTALSATCAVFGESELIGKIIEGIQLPSLAAGVNHSVVRRLMPLLRRHLPAPRVFFSGGVAQNPAVGRLLAAELGQEIEILPNPHFNGAIGCCFHGWEWAQKEKNSGNQRKS